MPQRKTKVSFEMREEIERLYREGMSTLEVAKEAGITHQSVTYHLRRRGVPLRTGVGARKGELHHNWRGGRYLENGYVVMKVDPTDPIAGPMATKGRGDYALEHRVVMARSLGRPLRTTETVHHMNGDKTDNRIENLQLRHGNHGAGVAACCNQCGSHDIRMEEL